MNSRTFAVIVVFAALTVVLNPTLTGIGVPAPYAPYLVYQIWEIPIVAVFLLFGPKYGVAISVMNALVLLAIFIGPGGLLAGPFYNLIAILSMMLGVYIPYLISSIRRKRLKTGETISTSTTLVIGASTTLGVLFRVAVMSAVNYIVLRYSYPIGYGMPEEFIIGSLPFIALFNATLALYTVPLGYLIADVVKTRIKFINTK